MIKKIDKWFPMIVITIGLLMITLIGCTSSTKASEPVIGEYIGTVYDGNTPYNAIRVYKDTKNNKLVYVFRDSVFVIAP